RADTPPEFSPGVPTGYRRTMAAVTTPESSPQSRVYFQTPPGTEEAETPVRKQGRVTVKYDRKELRKRLILEEWIIDQLTDLYDCEHFRASFILIARDLLWPVEQSVRCPFQDFVLSLFHGLYYWAQCVCVRVCSVCVCV
ncbi:hypothetical protein P4O66_008540, partial [Electrophorus voltai]